MTFNIFLYSQIFDTLDLDPNKYFSLVTLIITLVYGAIMYYTKSSFKKLYMILVILGSMATIIGHSVILGNTYQHLVYFLLFI